MKKRLGFIAIILSTVLTAFLAQARGFTCSPPYTTTAEAGMLPIGTVVEFEHWEGVPRTVIRTGWVACYYIRSKFPDPGGIVGLEDQAYVVDYGAADGSTVTLNRLALTVR